jgi:hypothetical protein
MALATAVCRYLINRQYFFCFLLQQGFQFDWLKHLYLVAETHE